MKSCALQAWDPQPRPGSAVGCQAMVRWKLLQVFRWHHLSQMYRNKTTDTSAHQALVLFLPVTEILLHEERSHRLCGRFKHLPRDGTDEPCN